MAKKKKDEEKKEDKKKKLATWQAVQEILSETETVKVSKTLEDGSLVEEDVNNPVWPTETKLVSVGTKDEPDFREASLLVPKSDISWEKLLLLLPRIAPGKYKDAGNDAEKLARQYATDSIINEIMSRRRSELSKESNATKYLDQALANAKNSGMEEIADFISKQRTKVGDAKALTIAEQFNLVDTD